MDVLVMGAGSWGTALAAVACQNQHHVTLWGRDAAQMDQIERTRENSRYLPGLRLPPGLRATADLRAALSRLGSAGAGEALLVSVVPSQVKRQVLAEVAPVVPPHTLVVSASKGIENQTLYTMDQVIAEVLPEVAAREQLAVLSGPSFARETAEGQPTAVVAAARRPEVAAAVQAAFQGGTFRVYSSQDVVGAEVGGAVKNVIAIACGMAEGLGFGHNTRAALVTRGLAEISRLGVRMGANPLTLMGLAGLGDLVLTCNGPQSRNRTVGVLLGRGLSLGEALAHMNQVAEGIKTAQSLHALAQRLEVDMPISHAIYRALYEERPVRQIMADLLQRPPKAELD